MKKMLLVLGVAAAAMTSCTSDEVLEMNPTNVIKFESFVNKGTRAVDPTTVGNLNKFYVFGYHGGDQNAIFYNNHVDNTAGTGWTNEINRNWTANKYFFGAYANKAESDKLDGNPTGEANVSFSNQGVLTIDGYSVGTMNPERHSTDDLLGAVKTVDLSNNTLNQAPGVVGLDFKHLLAQVKFEFCNNNQNYYMKVSNIEFSAPMTGTCTMGANGEIAWVKKSGENSLTYTYPGTANDVYIEAGNSFKSDSYLVLPLAIASKANFTIYFYQKDGENYNLVQTIAYNDVSLVGTPGPTDNTEPNENNTDPEQVSSWIPNFIYNYKAYFPVAPSGIHFTVNSVEGWPNSPTDVDDNIVNGPTVVF